MAKATPGAGLTALVRRARCDASATIVPVLAHATPAIVTAPAAFASPSAPPSLAEVLDAQALARLQELDPEGKAGLVSRVLATYVRSLQRLLDQLRAARAAADMQAVRLVAHTLKSSSASVGALNLSARCAEVERRLRDGECDGLAALLDQLTDEGGRVFAALEHPAIAQP